MSINGKPVPVVNDMDSISLPAEDRLSIVTLDWVQARATQPDLVTFTAPIPRIPSPQAVAVAMLQDQNSATRWWALPQDTMEAGKVDELLQTSIQRGLTAANAPSLEIDDADPSSSTLPNAGLSRETWGRLAALAPGKTKLLSDVLQVQKNESASPDLLVIDFSSRSLAVVQHAQLPPLPKTAPVLLCVALIAGQFFRRRKRVRETATNQVDTTNSLVSDADKDIL